MKLIPCASDIVCTRDNANRSSSSNGSSKNTEVIINAVIAFLFGL